MTENYGGRLILLIILILINALFAAAEIAVISLNGNKLRNQADDGNIKAAKLLKLVEKPTAFLSTIQIGITLAGFLASAFAAESFVTVFADWLVRVFGLDLAYADTLENVAVVLITLVLSYFTLVFGELVPKRIAMKDPEKLAFMFSGMIMFLAAIFRPVVWLLTVSTNNVLKLFGINPEDVDDSVSEEEIRLMVDIGGENGTIEPEERELIENIFEFNNMTAEDVMVHRKDMVMLYSDDTHEEVMRIIKESGLSRFPVCGEDVDDIIGILRTREYLLNIQSDHPKPLAELVAPAYFVPESVATDVLFRDMQKKKIHLAIVVDEYGGTSGLITLEDLLEEIVGNIYDEFDPQEQNDIIKLEDNLWRVSGSTQMEDLAKELGFEYDEDEDEYETLGGLVFSCLSEIPADGSKPVIEAEGLLIKVEELHDRRVAWATVSLIGVPIGDSGEKAI